MLGGNDNALFFQGLSGFFVLIFILIPILKWTFPTSKAVKAERAQIREMKREIRRIKRK